MYAIATTWTQEGDYPKVLLDFRETTTEVLDRVREIQEEFRKHEGRSTYLKEVGEDMLTGEPVKLGFADYDDHLWMVVKEVPRPGANNE